MDRESEDPGMDLAAREHFDSLHPPLRLSRRGFVQTSLSVGFAASVMPVCAQTVITTDTHGLTAGEVKIPVKDGEIPAYRAMPAGKTGLATVLIVHELWGVHEYIKDVCRRMAKLGYLAVAPELFVRQGDPSKPADTATLVKEIVSKVGDPQVMADLDATAAWAKTNGGGGKLGIAGFCWGGRIVWMYAAHNPNLAAGVSWYGFPARAMVAGDKSPLEIAGQIKTPILALYGAADAGIPVEVAEKMRDALKAGGNTRSETVIYPDMPHAFHADYRPNYRKAAAEDSWKRMSEWFARYLS